MIDHTRWTSLFIFLLVWINLFKTMNFWSEKYRIFRSSRASLMLLSLGFSTLKDFQRSIVLSSIIFEATSSRMYRFRSDHAWSPFMSSYMPLYLNISKNSHVSDAKLNIAALGLLILSNSNNIWISKSLIASDALFIQ